MMHCASSVHHLKNTELHSSGATLIEFSMRDGLNNDEFNGIGFVEISKIFPIQDASLFIMVSFGSVDSGHSVRELQTFPN